MNDKNNINQIKKLTYHEIFFEITEDKIQSWEVKYYIIIFKFKILESFI